MVDLVNCFPFLKIWAERKFPWWNFLTIQRVVDTCNNMNRVSICCDHNHVFPYWYGGCFRKGLMEWLGGEIGLQQFAAYTTLNRLILFPIQIYTQVRTVCKKQNISCRLYYSKGNLKSRLQTWTFEGNDIYSICSRLLCNSKTVASIAGLRRTKTNTRYSSTVRVHARMSVCVCKSYCIQNIFISKICKKS